MRIYQTPLTLWEIKVRRVDLSNIINSMGKAKHVMGIYRTSLTLCARHSTSCGFIEHHLHYHCGLG